MHNFLRVTQLVGGGARARTQVVLSLLSTTFAEEERFVLTRKALLL